jgi:hypothetical protein
MDDGIMMLIVSAVLDDLRREQGVSAWDDDTEQGFGLSDPIDDDDFGAFLAEALSSRREG